MRQFARSGYTESNDAYSALPLSQRQAIAAYVNELADRFEVLRLSYPAASSQEEYDWARRIAINLRYATTLVTNYEARNRVNPVWNARDLAMAENVRWIREREGPEGGVVVLAHNAHVQTAQSVAVPPNQAVQGMFLQALIGNDYRNIGFTFNRGAMWGEAGKAVALDTAGAGSIDGAMARVGLPIYFLDLGRVPGEGPVRRWLDQPLQQQSFSTEYNQLRSWDGLIFVGRITPSHLAPTPRP